MVVHYSDKEGVVCLAWLKRELPCRLLVIAAGRLPAKAITQYLEAEAVAEFKSHEA